MHPVTEGEADEDKDSREGADGVFEFHGCEMEGWLIGGTGWTAGSFGRSRQAGQPFRLI
jgi:hypothetical protein